MSDMKRPTDTEGEVTAEQIARELLEFMFGTNSYAKQYPGHVDRIAAVIRQERADQTAEINRLKAERDEWQTIARGWMNSSDKFASEVKQLTGSIETSMKHIEMCNGAQVSPAHAAEQIKMCYTELAAALEKVRKAGGA